MKNFKNKESRDGSLIQSTKERYLTSDIKYLSISLGISGTGTLIKFGL